MTNKELIDILHNIPEKILQSKNHEKLHIVINSGVPRLNLYTSKKFTAIEFTLFKTMQYKIWHDLTYEDIANQIESYLNILGFTKMHSTAFANGSIISDKDFYSITKEQIIQDLIKSI